ncbi:MAG: hypothetical protein IJB43_05360, partial [Clostridia bacterium]|nr:hypothetical protein [Clostridia bacterium]
PPPKSKILTAPLGARARPARQGGVFSVGKAAEKADLLIFIILQSATCCFAFGQRPAREAARYIK